MAGAVATHNVNAIVTSHRTSCTAVTKTKKRDWGNSAHIWPRCFIFSKRPPRDPRYEAWVDSWTTSNFVVLVADGSSMYMQVLHLAGHLICQGLTTIWMKGMYITSGAPRTTLTDQSHKVIHVEDWAHPQERLCCSFNKKLLAELIYFVKVCLELQLPCQTYGSSNRRSIHMRNSISFKYIYT